ncbi:hypothetical protein [Aneurinibacillus migulanus]|uniref:hypothetical protein n=1 Tax=Aneurinibacillus migulanus TaxID=47500 RepID=UPI00209E12B9|nr:hypothetical protein [Aneurinibacillus migulanus]MCP1355434.1 hypothetical protein [Aneurinibacillus migulanus]
MKNSITAVEVCTVQCSMCENKFYEFDDNDLATCPHCNADFIDVEANVIKTKQMFIGIDYATGEIRKK